MVKKKKSNWTEEYRTLLVTLAMSLLVIVMLTSFLLAALVAWDYVVWLLNAPMVLDIPVL